MGPPHFSAFSDTFATQTKNSRINNCLFYLLLVFLDETRSYGWPEAQKPRSPEATGGRVGLSLLQYLIVR